MTTGQVRKVSKLNKVASALALVIGAMAIFAGGQVLSGTLPDYYVINWLPVYNFVIGVISVFFSSIVIWKNNRLALPTAIGTLGLHAIVMLILQAAYRSVVASESIIAMTVRLVTWIIIVGLLILQQRNKK
jgi:hypothetical protein